jgi:uncharacterized membrane protein
LLFRQDWNDDGDEVGETRSGLINKIKKKAVDDDSSPRYCRRQYLKWAYGTIKWINILKLLK